jgi:hypothetical protein
MIDTSKCKRCNSENTASICGKSSDLNGGYIRGEKFDGYVPEDIGVGGGDYIELNWCIDCGQIQGLYNPSEAISVEQVKQSAELYNKRSNHPDFA